jgi:hypothetical protein
MVIMGLSPDIGIGDIIIITRGDLAIMTVTIPDIHQIIAMVRNIITGQIIAHIITGGKAASLSIAPGTFSANTPAHATCKTR